MTFSIVFCVVALGVATTVAQSNDGEIAGRINTKDGSRFPAFVFGSPKGASRHRGQS